MSGPRTVGMRLLGQDFGHSQLSGCGYYVQVQGTAFHSINGGKPICGTSF